METFDRKGHWDNIYNTKQISEVGWYQSTPVTSLDLIAELNLLKTANIIDIGGGDSYLVDHLLDLGYENITVLDISAKAIERAKLRLGERGINIKWIETDISNFKPSETYDLWHDRAAFHFLNKKKEIKRYFKSAQKCIGDDGNLIIGTFSEDGPKKCSGIDIKQYSEAILSGIFEPSFKKMKCLKVDHETPFNTVQNFIFCSFKKLKTHEDIQ